MKRKVAFLFSGQGSQYVGMGQELYESYSECEKIFDYADEVLGRSIKELCFKGSIEDLTKTVNTQPAIFTFEAAILAVLRKYGIKPDAVAGFSVGEYAALYASGFFDLMTSLYLVNQRSLAMDNVSKNGIYGMGAINGDNIGKVESICKRYNNVWVANYNTHRQVSITGEKRNVQCVIEDAKKLGYSAIELNVSGAFHSEYMKEAACNFEESIRLIVDKENKIPIVLNLTGNYYQGGDNIKEIMKKQMYSPVCWVQSIDKLIKDGFNTFIEIGPGRTLYNFTKEISNQEITILNVENMESLYTTIDEFYN